MQKWRKFDLHLHTKKTARDSSGAGENEFISISKSNVEDFINKLKENDIEQFAITNHNIFDIEQFQLIKEHANKNDINVIPGVEVNVALKKSDDSTFVFQCNVLFNDKDEEALSWNKNIINDNFQTLNEKQSGKHNEILMEDFINRIVEMKGKIILILDSGKGSSQLRKLSNQIENSFWFYFDAHEGSRKHNAEIINSNLKKMADGKFDAKEVIKIFGTDNRNFNFYPGNAERKGWTGDYFFSDPSFQGLLSVINYPYLFHNDSNNDANDHPILNDVVLEKIAFEYKGTTDNISLDRGVNVILGRRGSGKSILLNQIKEQAFKKVPDKNKIFELEQNKLSNFIANSSSEISQYMDDLEKPILFRDINSSFFKEAVSKTIPQIEINNPPNMQSIFIALKDMLNSEVENTEISEEESILNVANNYFQKFKDKSSINKEIIELMDFFEKTKNNKITIELLKSSNFKLFKKSIKKLVDDKTKFININYTADISSRQDVDSAEEVVNIQLQDYEKSILSFSSQINIVKNNLIELMQELSKEKIFSSAELSHFKILVKPSVQTMQCDDFIKEIGQYNKVNNLSDFFVKNMEELPSLKFRSRRNSLNEERGFKLNIKKTLDGDDISELSPGQMVERYIENIFKATTNKVIIIDQPEDQLDALTVSEKIVEPIRNMYAEFIKSGVQIIFVTHDPKIAVNLGAIKIIECSEEKGEYLKKEWGISHFFTNDVLINKIDGKKKYVHKRSEIYGRNN